MFIIPLVIIPIIIPNRHFSFFRVAEVLGKKRSAMSMEFQDIYSSQRQNEE